MFALARLATLTGQARYRDAATRALDALVAAYDFFLGGFFYGEEHWTCIAAAALAPAGHPDRYRAFCDGYAAFLRTQQVAEGAPAAIADLVGSYEVTPFVAPFNTPSGSRTEAMISTYELEVAAGAPDPAVRRQIEAALGYLLAQQVRADDDLAVVGSGVGGVPGSPVDRVVRIDYVQHVGSAMIRAAQFADGAGP